ncbi:MAG: sigma-70 family RNA polymerase sigma factor [Firmicutes bacterium]|nr:sigma-70 family RNA polymerase sigma factor [Bacillota bacterium]
MISEVRVEFKDEDEKIASFEETAIPNMDSLYRTALRLTRNEKDAEDLVQEVYLRAFKSFHQFKPGTNCKAWLFKILNNLHINRFQKSARTPSSLSFDEVEDFYLYNRITETPYGNTPKDMEEEFLNSFLDDEVKEAIEKLPYEFRITVILADIEGFHYQEIAEILSCPIGTVRSRLSRGRKLLQKYLWDYAKKRDYTKETLS